MQLISSADANLSAVVYLWLCGFCSERFPLPLGSWGVLRYLSRVLRKPVFGVSDQVRHKPGCTATEDGYSLEISDVGSRGIVLSI